MGIGCVAVLIASLYGINYSCIGDILLITNNNNTSTFVRISATKYFTDALLLGVCYILYENTLHTI